MRIEWEKLKNAVISISSSGDNTIIAAPTDGYIAIDFITFLPTTAVGVTFKSGSTAISGTFPLDAKQAVTFENAIDSHDGVITCARNQAFVMNLDSAVQTGGNVRYRIVGNQ